MAKVAGWVMKGEKRPTDRSSQLCPSSTDNNSKNELERRQKKYFFPSPFAAPWRSKHFFAF